MPVAHFGVFVVYGGSPVGLTLAVGVLEFFIVTARETGRRSQGGVVDPRSAVSPATEDDMVEERDADVGEPDESDESTDELGPSRGRSVKA